MAALNLREFPDHILTDLKARAAEHGVTLRDYAIMVLGLHREMHLTPLTPDAKAKMARAKSIPGVTVARDLRYERPKHASDCHCYVCQPPK